MEKQEGIQEEAAKRFDLEVRAGKLMVENNRLKEALHQTSEVLKGNMVAV